MEGIVEQLYKFCTELLNEMRKTVEEHPDTKIQLESNIKVLSIRLESEYYNARKKFPIQHDDATAYDEPFTEIYQQAFDKLIEVKNMFNIEEEDIHTPLRKRILKERSSRLSTVGSTSENKSFRKKSIAVNQDLKNIAELEKQIHELETDHASLQSRCLCWSFNKQYKKKRKIESKYANLVSKTKQLLDLDNNSNSTLTVASSPNMM